MYVDLIYACLLVLTSTVLQADRTESYTKIEPFQEKHDTSVECVYSVFRFISCFEVICRFFYKPITLTVLSVAFAILAYIATTQDVLEEGRDKRRV